MKTIRSGRTWSLPVVTAALLLAGGPPAPASIFINWGRDANDSPVPLRWPTSPRPGGGPGFARIRVCVIPGSSVEQRNQDIAHAADDNPDIPAWARQPILDFLSQVSAAYVHAENPSLDQVLAQIRSSLAAWEGNGGVRFDDWRSCDQLTAAERAEAVGFYINPDARNEARAATLARGSVTKEDPGVSILPWGQAANDDQCIRIDFDALREHFWDPTYLVFKYYYSCPREYAAHEFGHLLGFGHEWNSPAKPDECPTEPRDGPIPAGSWATTYDLRYVYTVVNPTAYDWDSVMTYGTGCADVTGERFGSPSPSATDIRGLQAVYPLVTDVGVLRTGGTCAGAEAVDFLLHDESTGNTSGTTGWTGDSGTEAERTHLAFCRADGARFRPAAGPYAVLKLGQVCPAGSFEVVRTFDNEDDQTRNVLPDAEAGFPNGETRRPKPQFPFGTDDLQLHFCYFPAATQDPAPLPALDRGYGVFAPGDFPGVLTTGTIRIDEENDDNASEIDVPPGTLEGLIDAGEDTVLHVAKVQGTPPFLFGIRDRVTDEDVPLGPLEFQLFDVDTPAEELTVTVSVDPSFARATVSGTGEIRALTITPVADVHGTTTVTLTASDDRASRSMTFRLTIRPVNDPPVVEPISDQVMNEDGELVVGGAYHDVDGDVPSIRATSSNQALVPNANISGAALDANLQMRIVPAANKFGQATITVRVVDAAQAEAVAQFLLTVNPVNDAPVVTLSAAGTTIHLDEGRAMRFTASGTDADGDPITYDWQAQWLSGGGVLQPRGAEAILRADDGPGITFVLVTGRDPSGAASLRQEVGVFVENLPPTVVAGPDASGYWGRGIPFDAKASDASLADVAAGLPVAWEFGDGQAATTNPVSHAYAEPGVYTARATTTDKDGGVGSGQLIVTVARRGTAVALTSPPAAPFGFETLEARLSDTVDAGTARLSGRKLVFLVDGRAMAATTDDAGVAGVRPWPPLRPGIHQVKVDFAGDTLYVPASAVSSLQVLNSAGSVSGKVTTTAGEEARISVHNKGRLSGHFRFGQGQLDAAVIDGLGISADGRAAWLAGADDRGQAFLAYVEDNGDLGRSDVFSLWIGGLLVADGAIGDGNVHVRTH